MRQQDEILCSLKSQPPGGRHLLFRQMETLPMAPDSEDVLAALEAGLSDSDPTPRSQALASRGLYLPRLLRYQALDTSETSLLECPDDPFTAQAAAMLAPLVEGLVKAVSAKDSRRLRALVALGLFPGKLALQRLQEESRRADSGLLVAEALARHGGPEAAKVLNETILRVPSPFRSAQVAQLRFVPSGEGMELVRRAIRKGDPAMAVGGAIALEGFPGPELADLAMKAFERSSDGWAALHALESLRRLSRREDAELVMSLVDTTSFPLVQALGLRVLGSLRSSEVGPWILSRFEALPDSLRPYALESLVLVGAPEREARPLLEGLVGSPQLPLALPAVKAMLAFDPDLAVGLVSQILARAEPVARFIGAQCLAYVHTEASREQLAVMVREDRAPPVRVQALLSLTELTDVTGIPEAVVAGFSDDAPEVRRAAARAITRIDLPNELRDQAIERLEAGLAAEPDVGQNGPWARAIACHVDPDRLSEMIRRQLQTDPLAAAFLLRAANPNHAPISRLLALLARQPDRPARAEVCFGLTLAGELSGAADLGKIVAEGGEREALEACAVAERLGMLLPYAPQLKRMAGLVRRVAEGKSAAVGFTTTARLKRMAEVDGSLEALLKQKARTGRRPSGRQPEEKTLPFKVVAQPGESGGVEKLSPYASCELQRAPGSAGLPRQAVSIWEPLREVARQLGIVGIVWVAGLVVLFGAIGWQVYLVMHPRIGPREPEKVIPRIVQVESVRGTATDGSGKPLSARAYIAPNRELFQVGPSSHLTLRLAADDSTLDVAGNSRLSLTLVEQPADGGRPILEVRDVAGTVKARVAKNSVRVHLWVKNLRVESDGGLFLVRPKELVIGRGKVDVYQGEHKLDIQKNQRADFDSNGDLGTPAAFQPTERDWEID